MPKPSVNRVFQISCLSSPRLSGTNFSIPEAIYSLNSLGDLNRYSKPVALLKHKADKDSSVGWILPDGVRILRLEACRGPGRCQGNAGGSKQGNVCKRDAAKALTLQKSVRLG